MYETWKYYIHFLALGFSFLDTFWKEKSIRQFLHVSFLSHFKNSNRTNRQEQSMLCPCQGREKVNFLTSREASWRSRLSANGKGGEARTNFSHHSSITVQSLSHSSLPAPILSGLWGIRLLPRAPSVLGGRDIILQQLSCLFRWIRNAYALASKISETP